MRPISLASGPTALAPSGGGTWSLSGRRTPRPLPPKGGRRCPALFGRNPWQLQVVDMTVVSGKRAVVGAGSSSPADVFTAAGNRLMTKVLLIEDDSETAEEITAELADRGFEVEWSANGIEGLDKARSSQPDAMIVDRLLPGMDGLTVIETLRKDDVRTPVLVLSALGAVDDRVRGLRMGGDDYLTKPFALVELVARVEALLRRPAESRETTLRAGPLELDLIERTAKRGDRVIDLLPREFRLLEYMMQRSDQLLTRAMLLEEVWNYKFVPATNLVDVHMGRLRHKVDGPGDIPMIHNVRGAGFILRTGP
jgi:two-component system OmpR family response regulator